MLLVQSVIFNDANILKVGVWVIVALLGIIVWFIKRWVNKQDSNHEKYIEFNEKILSSIHNLEKNDVEINGLYKEIKICVENLKKAVDTMKDLIGKVNQEIRELKNNQQEHAKKIRKLEKG